MTILRSILVSALLLVTAACGGGGGDSTPAATTTIGGVASAGIIKGGTVKVFSPYSSLTGADKKQVGPTATTSLVDGSYTVNIGAYTGPVVVEVTGGSYVDEATGSTILGGIPANAPLRAAIGNASGTVKVAVTPLTELAVRQTRELDSGKTLTAANIEKANAQIADLFKVADIIKTSPLDASAPLVGTQAEKDYTLALATISKYGDTAGSASLDAALDSLIAKVTTAGTMEITTAAAISSALTDFIADPDNKTDVIVIPVSMQNIGKTTIKLVLALAGTDVKALTAVVTLPAGVTVSTGPVNSEGIGATLDGVLTSGSATSTPSGSSGNGVLTLNVSSPTVVINSGDVVTVNANLAAGATAPVAANIAMSYELFKSDGATTSGTLTLH